MKLTLRALRINLNMSRFILAEKLGVSVMTIHNWENGGNIPSDKLLKIAEIFEISIDKIDLGKEE